MSCASGPAVDKKISREGQPAPLTVGLEDKAAVAVWTTEVDLIFASTPFVEEAGPERLKVSIVMLGIAIACTAVVGVTAMITTVAAFSLPNGGHAK
jgi:hypothetical protein